MSSTTGNLEAGGGGSRQSPSTPSPQATQVGTLYCVREDIWQFSAFPTFSFPQGTPNPHLVLSVSQIQASGGGLLILNNGEEQQMPGKKMQIFIRSSSMIDRFSCLQDTLTVVSPLYLLLPITQHSSTRTSLLWAAARTPPLPVPPTPSPRP